MKLEDVIKRLQFALPMHTDKFTEKFGVVAVTDLGGGILEVETDAPHKMTTGDVVNVQNVRMVNPITDVSFLDGVVTATTTVKHDLTEDFEPRSKLDISGFTNVPDGEFDLINVPKGNIFTFAFTVLPTGPGQLNEIRIDGANGRFVVTVTSSTKFTYSAPDNSFTSFLVDSTSVVETATRISGSALESKVVDYYTAQPKIDALWGFVIPGEVTVSHTREVQSDANTRISRKDSHRYECIQEFSLLVVRPTTNEIGSRAAYDEMIDIRAALCRSIVGIKFDSGFCEKQRFVTTYNGDEFFDYVGAYYIHKFNFLTVFNFTPGDTVGLPDTRAFRDFEINFKLPFDDFNDIKKIVKGELP